MLEHSEMANDLLEVFLQLAPERLQQMEAAATEADGNTLGRGSPQDRRSRRSVGVARA